jgi:hypothetical protein
MGLFDIFHLPILNEKILVLLVTSQDEISNNKFQFQISNNPVATARGPDTGSVV